MELLDLEKLIKYIQKIILNKYINLNMEIVDYGLMDIILNNIKQFYLMNLQAK